MGYSQECVRVVGFDSPSQGQEGLGRPLSCISQLSLQAAPFRISSKAHGCPLNISCTSTSSRLHRTPLLHFCITFYAEMGLLQIYSEERNIPSLWPPRRKNIFFKYKEQIYYMRKKCRVHFVTMFLLLSDPEGKYFITAAVAKSTVVSQPSPRRGQHVTWLWARSLRGTRAFLITYHQF